MVIESRFAQYLTKQSKTALFPFAAAKCKGVKLFSVRELTFALFLHKISKIDKWAFEAAK